MVPLPKTTARFGILTQPLNVELASIIGDAPENRTYIAASYVKFAESAGARVVPVHFDSSDAELRELFGQINGLIFPGGGANIFNVPGNRFREAAKLLFDLALASNKKGDPFPIHGTCLGFQLLTVLVAQTDDVICRGCFQTEGTPLALNFTRASNRSRLFSAMPASLIAALATQKITENSHSSGVAPPEFEKNSRLKDFFRVLSTNEDSSGLDFVSTIEATHLPITATQWHPEKNNLEWGKIGKLGYHAIPHSSEAVLVSQYFANDFVNRARQNTHRFKSSDAENRALIYNHAAVPDPQGYFAQVYLWDGRGRVEEPVAHPSFQIV